MFDIPVRRATARLTLLKRLLRPDVSDREFRERDAVQQPNRVRNRGNFCVAVPAPLAERAGRRIRAADRLRGTSVISGDYRSVHAAVVVVPAWVPPARSCRCRALRARNTTQRSAGFLKSIPITPERGHSRRTATAGSRCARHTAGAQISNSERKKQRETINNAVLAAANAKLYPADPARPPPILARFGVPIRQATRPSTPACETPCTRGASSCVRHRNRAGTGVVLSACLHTQRAVSQPPGGPLNVGQTSTCRCEVQVPALCRAR